MGTARSRPPKTAELWHAQSPRAHQLLQHAPLHPDVAVLSAAQRCPPDHLSGVLSCLTCAEFAASIRTCRLFHAAGELRSSVPDPPALVNPPLFQPEFLHRVFRLDSILPGLSARRCTGLAKLKGTVAGAIDSWREPVWSQCQEMHLSASVPSNLGNQPPEYVQQPHALLAGIVGLQRIRALHVDIGCNPAVVDGLIEALASRLQLLHLSVDAVTASLWLAHVPSFVNLRVLKLVIPAAADCDPAVIFGPLLHLASLSVTTHFGESSHPPDWATPFCRALALTLRRLSVEHSLRVLECIKVVSSFLLVLTKDPSATNDSLPLPPLTHIAHDAADKNFEIVPRLLALPALTSLRTSCPLRLLLCDAEPVPDDLRHVFARVQAKPVMSWTLPPLPQLKALSCPGESPQCLYLPALRRCGSLESLGAIVAVPQLPELIDALEAGAAGLRPLAAAVAYAPLQCLSIVLGGRDIVPDWTPLLRLQNLREIILERWWKAIFAPADQLSLAQTLAQLPRFETLRFGGSSFEAALLPCRWTAGFLRAISTSRSWVSCHALPNEPVDSAFLNKQLQMLTAAECVALRHFALHLQPDPPLTRDVLRIVRCPKQAGSQPKHLPASELPAGAHAGPGRHEYQWRGFDETGRSICGVKQKR